MLLLLLLFCVCRMCLCRSRFRHWKVTLNSSWTFPIAPSENSERGWTDCLWKEHRKINRHKTCAKRLIALSEKNRQRQEHEWMYITVAVMWKMLQCGSSMSVMHVCKKVKNMIYTTSTMPCFPLLFNRSVRPFAEVLLFVIN